MSLSRIIFRTALGAVLPAALFLFAANSQAQDASADAAAQAVQQSIMISVQATQQANDAMMQAAQQANQAAMQAAQQAAQQASPPPAPFPRPSPYGRADKPHFSPASGKFASGVRVSIQDSAPKASIFYTLDGTEPTTSSTPYTRPVLVSSTTQLRAIARSPIYSPSKVASAKYVIK
jgi:hypothetical protein